MAYWLAVRTVGAFRRGNVYTSQQLGVLGRMAVKCGHIIHADDPPARVASTTKDGKPKMTRPRGARRAKAKEVTDGVQGDIQAGSGEDVRDPGGA